MRYTFRERTLDTEQYILDRADGPTQLQPKVFQVLLYLLTHRDRVISKQELSEQVWPAQFISDATLEGVIKAVRRAVGDDGRTQWCIQTRRGQGYRFVALVDIENHIDLDAGPSAEPHDATRRQLTAMSCELVEAARLSQQFDPEVLRDLVRAYQSMCKAVMQRFEGAIAQDYGTGLVTYFGYPPAHEDAAYRAVRAGLDLVSELSELNRLFLHENDVRLSIRVGLHTGLVVVEPRDVAVSQTPIAIGAPLQVAVQIQRLAEPDTVWMSPATAELVQGLFVSREVAAPPELDSELPTPLIHVLRESRARTRFEVARSRGLTPLVGRDKELGLLQQRWEQAGQGHGQVVLLHGESGIGKSRLVEALREQVARQADGWVELRCTSMTQQSAFYPVLSYLRQRLQWDSDASTDTKLTVLESELEAYGLPLHEAVPLVAGLFAIPLDGRYTPVPLPPDQQRQKTLEALTTWLLRGTASEPALMVWEDIHWADHATLELLTLLLDQVSAAPILVLLTFRTPFQSPWPLRSYFTQLALDRLSRDQVAQMIAYEAVGMSLPDEITQEVLNKSDGVPLFVEELMKLILEAKTVRQENGQYILSKPLADLAIPNTLQDLLMARLDQLGSARGILQLGSMLGREFTQHLIQAVTRLEASELQRHLRQLVRSELLHQQGMPPQAIYLFKHALIQDAAYHSMLKRHRRDSHLRIAQVLEQQFPDIVESQPELLARHYTEAKRPSQAVVYWRQAGRAALHRFAYLEAIQHSRSGLEQLAAMPASTSIEHELVLQCTLGMAYTTTKGFAAPEVQQAYGRGLELCRQVGDFAQLLPILGGLRTFYVVRGELRTARELAEKQLDLAQQQQNSTSLIQAYTNLGSVLLYLGELRNAREKLHQGRQLLTSLVHYDVSEMRDSRVNCLTTAALALLLGGDADQALVCSQEALTLAQNLSQPFSLAFALGMTSFFHLLRRDYPNFQKFSNAVLTLSRDQGFASFVTTGEIGQRLARVVQGMGDAEELTSLHQAIAARRAAGMDILGTGFLLCLVEAYQRAGHSESGQNLLAEIKEMMDAKEEYVFEAEWYRLKGEFELQQSIPDVTQAESYFHCALEVARRRHAKWWALRAAVSLAKLWHQQGKREVAGQLLGEIYRDFTEGFETSDLQAARACLERLTA